MRIALFVVVTVVALALHTPAEACSCLRPEGPSEELAKFDAVFEGKVVSIGDEGMNRRVELAVARAWKGIESPTVTVTTANNSAACGFAFAEGESYLLYADALEGALHVNICSRSRDIAGAGEDLAALGAPAYQPGSAPSSDPAVSDPGPGADPGPVPIEPPPPPPAPKSGGCAGCSAAAPSDPSGWLVLFLALPFLRRRF